MRRLLAAHGVVLIAILLICAAALWGQAASEQARGWTSHTYQVLLKIRSAQETISEQRIAIRNFLIGSADDAELEPYRQGIKAFSDELHELRALTADNMAQQQRLDRLESLYATWRSQIAEQEIRLAANVATQHQAVELFSSEQSHAQMQGIRALLDSVEDTERTLLEQRAEHAQQVIRDARWLVIALLLLVLMTKALAIRQTSRRIVAPIVRMTSLMTRLTHGDDTIEIPYRDWQDEIGATARALEIFRALTRDTSARDWVKGETATLSSALQLAKTLDGYGTELLRALATTCGAMVGTFHLRVDGGWRCIGLFGTDAPDASSSWRTLRDEAYRLKQPVELAPAPAGYLRVTSSTGAASPGEVLILPALVADRCVAVLEVGTLSRFTSVQRTLLDELMPVVALSLDNLVRTLHTHELLEESRAQAEELRASEEALRAQQEELRATNDELEQKSRQLQEQAQALRASEEELRVQSEELQASNEELRQTSQVLNEQHVALEALQRETLQKAAEVERASRYKSEFLANMSHELRTPLNSLLILSKSLADNETDHLDAEEVESARIIHESGSNLLRLINDILDLSKVEAGKMDVVRDTVSLSALTTRLQRIFQPLAHDKGLRFDIDIEAGLPATIESDSARLEQVLNNLLGNAFKFTRDGGVTLRLRHPSAALAARAGLEGEAAVAIEVADTGVGIPEGKFDQVFRAFEQADGTTSRQFGGTGLGLSIARSMAQLLGGDIVLESTVGQGSTFTLLLPCVASESATPVVVRPLADEAPPAAVAFKPTVMIDDDRARAAQTTGQPIILAVEDDPAFIRVLVDLIRRKGFLALAATNGEEGLALARELKPTGILLDLMLPGMDGWTVLDRLKADVGTRHIPVHIVSATEDAVRGLEHGAVGFLTKPVSKEALGEAFERLLHFAQGQTRRVLVIDDDEGSRAAVRKLVAGRDVEIIESDSGEAALDVLASEAVDCLILDLGLPGMSGFEFLDEAAKRGAVPPVVVYSGRELTRDENLRLRAYTDSIVIKGARSPERLIDEVSLFLHSIHAKTPSAPPAAAVQPEASLAGRTVLVVDDDMRNIFALSKTLRAKGLQVIVAQDGHKALRQLEESDSIELVLMDIMMPGMDGYETMREIRRQPRFGRLPIIALTAKAMQGDREKCLEAGANDYLSKPVDVDKLLSMMRVYLGRG